VFKHAAIFPVREIAFVVQRASSFAGGRLRGVFGGLIPLDSIPAFVPSLAFRRATRVECPRGEGSQDDSTVRERIISVGAEPSGFHLPEIHSQLVFYCE
jgi:hypothetical protein